MRVLVIDDEPLVAQMVRRTLEDACEVVVRHSAEEALELLDAGEVFDAVLTDLMMPGLDGIELHAELRRRHPEVLARLLFLSGGATNARARTFLSMPGIRWLDKPFRAEELTRRVREIAGVSAP